MGVSGLLLFGGQIDIKQKRRVQIGIAAEGGRGPWTRGPQV